MSVMWVGRQFCRSLKLEISIKPLYHKSDMNYLLNIFKSVCVCVCERESETETETERERQRDRGEREGDVEVRG